MSVADSLLSGPSSSRSAWLRICGDGWLAPAWRAGALIFVVAVLPAFLGQSVSSVIEMMFWLAIYALLVLAIYRYLQLKRVAQTESPEVRALGDDFANPTPLDALVNLELQQKEKPREWSLELLHALEWKRMADLCVAFYKERDLLAGRVTVGEDGSLDAILHQSEQEQAFALMHCKARGEQEVGLQAVEDLLPKMQEAGVVRAFFMGVWSFSEEARHLARSHQITLVDDRMFLALLARLPHDDSQRLLNLAVEGDYSTPSCPGCRLKMLPRQNAQGRYWGCRAYPHCKHTLGMHV